MLISIFIPTGGRSKSLKNLLLSLTKQSFKNFEIIVVDYTISSQTQSLIHKFAKSLSIRYFVQKKPGLTHAANLALQLARGSIFIRTDDDVVVSKTWLEETIKTFKDSTIGGATGPAIIENEYLKNRDLLIYLTKFKEGNLFMRLFGSIYNNFFLEGKALVVDQWFRSGAFSLGALFKSSLKEPFQDVINLEPCNFIVRTSLLRKIQGFDPIYVGVGEYHEADAAFRIMRLGYRLVFNPKILVYHCPSRDGVFKNRSGSFSRMENFIMFYFRFLKPLYNGVSFQFVGYIFFLWAYYTYAAIKYKNIFQLGAYPGFFFGLLKYYIQVLNRKWKPISHK